MNVNEIKGNITELKGRILTEWGKLTDDDLSTWKGRKDELLGKLQARYGEAKETFEDKVDELLRRF